MRVKEGEGVGEAEATAAVAVKRILPYNPSQATFKSVSPRSSWAILLVGQETPGDVSVHEHRRNETKSFLWSLRVFKGLSPVIALPGVSKFIASFSRNPNKG